VITDAYLVVRYGELPESLDQVEGVLAAWQNIAAVGKQKLKTFKQSRDGT